MNDIKKTVRQFYESWDLRDPERGAAVIAEDCRFEDVARSEAQTGPDGYRMDYNRWRAAFPMERSRSSTSSPVQMVGPWWNS